jgi:integrase
MKFTKSTVAALSLPAGKSDSIVFDGATPGFGVRLREGGKRTWIAQIRVHGRTKRLAIGDVAQIELEIARAAAKRFFAEATLGQDPAAKRAEARAKAAATVGSIIEKYLAVREPVARRNTYRHQVRYLREYFAGLHGYAIDSLTRRDVALALSGIAEQHGMVSAARARSVLSAFFTWALKEGIAGEANPVTFTNDPAPGEKPRERVLSPSEIRAIWQGCADDEHGKILRLLFYTACRRAEIGSLEWSEINFDRAMLVIPGDKTKNHRTHRLPLVTEAVEILQSIPRREGNPHLFGGPRGFTTFSSGHDQLSARLATTGHVLEHWTLHDIRRTIRSEMGDLGVEPWTGEQILNHARAGIEGTYNWAKLEKQMRQALELWADRLRGIVEGTESTIVALRA